MFAKLTHPCFISFSPLKKNTNLSSFIHLYVFPKVHDLFLGGNIKEDVLVSFCFIVQAMEVSDR